MTDDDEGAFDEAFKRGYAMGRTKALDEVREAIRVASTRETGLVTRDGANGGGDRQPTGTVRPELLRQIRMHGEMTTAALRSATGFKPSSVKGTLRQLSLEGIVVRGPSGAWSITAVAAKMGYGLSGASTGEDALALDS